MRVENVEQFTKLVSDIEATPGYQRPAAFGLGLATFACLDLERPSQIGEKAAVLDTWFPAPNCDENFGTAAILAKVCGHVSGSKSYRLGVEQLRTVLEAFAPFLSDGKDHPNIVAVQQLLRSLERLALDAERYERNETSLDRVLPRAVVVTFVADHFIRPVIIGGATRLPFLWVLLGILGGVETFGIIGLFIGPVVMSILIQLWRDWADAPTR